MNRTRLASLLAGSGSRWRIVTAVVTRASSNHFSTCDSMTATILKLRRKNSLELEPVIGVQPADARYKSEVAARLEEVSAVGEEVGVYVRPSRRASSVPATLFGTAPRSWTCPPVLSPLAEYRAGYRRRHQLPPKGCSGPSLLKARCTGDYPPGRRRSWPLATRG